MFFQAASNKLDLNSCIEQCLEIKGPTQMLLEDIVSPNLSTIIKTSSKKCFEVAENIVLRNTLFKKFKRFKLPVDIENHQKAHHEVKRLSAKKKKFFFKTKLVKNIDKCEEFSKSLKSINQSTSCVIY